VTTSALDAGRRSRRGFGYQDAVTLLDCLDLHSGVYDHVGFEELDDIVCVSAGHATYRQVKTKENASRHSIATVCRPEIKDRVETSILGRLFSGKPLTDNTRFCLLLNETPSADLNAFKIERGDVRGVVPDAYCRGITDKLRDFDTPDDLEISWFVDRFEVIVEARTIEQVEDLLLHRLGQPVAASLGQAPLLREVEEVLIRLFSLVTRDAMARQARRWDASIFDAALAEAVVAATGRRPDGTTAPLETLMSKLAPAGLTPEETAAQNDALLVYRRRYRSAVGGERTLFDSLNDHVFAICSEVSASRRAGEIAPGPIAYAATMMAVCERPLIPARAVSQPDRLAALSDVTARCENRYTDDT
jgi:hypothetical protein